MSFFKESVIFNRDLDRTQVKPDDFKGYNSKEITDKKFKAIIPIADNYFHFFSDFLGPITLFLDDCIKNNIKSVHLIFTSHGNLKVVNKFDGFLNFCLEQYANNIDLSHEVIDFNEIKYLKADNVAIMRQADIGESIYKMYNNSIAFSESDTTVKPWRKVFLVRSLDKIKDNSLNRNANELEVKEFFSSIGFEIVNGEQFSSLKDQLEFFNQVSVFAALSGSGLTSSMFMQENQTVIEIVTPIKFGDYQDRYELHNFYKTISMLKDHRFINISNINKSSDSIIEDLKIVSRILEQG